MYMQAVNSTVAVAMRPADYRYRAVYQRKGEAADNHVRPFYTDPAAPGA